jgi:hypothetical protein
MHVGTFLHNLLAPVTHKSRCNVLTEIVNGIIRSKQLQLSAVGRSLDSPISERSGIRKVDRFLANKFWQTESKMIYGVFVKLLIGSKTRPLIIVDWTKLPNCKQYAIRAALAAEGRALTLYEEVHPKEEENSPVVHKYFLRKLKSMLPKGCNPIIVTDAGFKNPWFKEVQKLKWDYVGRIRGEGHCKSEDDADFFPHKELHQKATEEPQYLGEKILTKKNSLNTHFYAVKYKNKGRKNLTKKGNSSKHKDSLSYSKSYREPWLLVSSLHGHGAAKKVVKIYYKRMTIEEAFRDMKSSRYGLGMDKNKTIKIERLTTWLLLNMITCFLAWFVGREAEKAKLHYQFQANSTKNRRVLSFFYLGCQIIKKTGKLLIPPLELIEFEDFFEVI